MPGLQGLLRRSTAADNRRTDQGWQSKARLSQFHDHRPAVDSSRRRCHRRRRTGPRLELHRALLPKPGHRGLRLRDRLLPRSDRQGRRREGPRQVERGSQEQAHPQAGRQYHRRSRKPRFHRHAVLRRSGTGHARASKLWAPRAQREHLKKQSKRRVDITTIIVRWIGTGGALTWSNRPPRRRLERAPRGLWTGSSAGSPRVRRPDGCARFGPSAPRPDSKSQRRLEGRSTRRRSRVGTGPSASTSSSGMVSSRQARSIRLSPPTRRAEVDDAEHRLVQARARARAQRRPEQVDVVGDEDQARCCAARVPPGSVQRSSCAVPVGPEGVGQRVQQRPQLRFAVAAPGSRPPRRRRARRC